MSEHFNGLTPAEAERLAYLIEEAAEVQQIACKVLRHGYESRDPTKATPANPSWGAPERNTSPTNRDMLAAELRDMLGAVERMRVAGDIDKGLTSCGSPDKGARYMHHQQTNT